MLEKTKNIFELLDELKRAGASEIDTYQSISGFLEQTARETGVPRHGHFELTPLCNLDCKMCYVHLDEVQMRDKKLLSASTWIDLMQQAIDAGMSSASLSGGECLTYPQFDKIYLFLKAKGVSLGVLTNGLLLTRERIEFFKKYRPDGIQISLYGDSEKAYEQVTGKKVFSTVLENVLQAKEAELPVHFMISPNRYMAESVKNTIRLAKELGIPYYINSLLVTPRNDTGRKKDDYDIDIDFYLDILKYDRQLNDRDIGSPMTVSLEPGRETDYINAGVRCGSGKSAFSIRWDGTMHPCILMDSVVAYPLRDGFRTAWEQINFDMNHFPRFEKCEECKYSNACNFCAAENEKMGDRYRLCPAWCKNAKKMLENGLVKIEIACEQGDIVKGGAN